MRKSLPEPNYDPTILPHYDVAEVERLQREHLSNYDDRCVQCRHKPDGEEYLLAPSGGGEPVLLHEMCWQFYKPKGGDNGHEKHDDEVPG